MFSRRHPFLFSMLVMAGIGAVGLIMLAIIVSFIGGGMGYARNGNIGVVTISGAIVESQTILHQIKTFRESDNIKAIVIRIDSPGGGVGPSQEVYREIRKTRDQKKVIASLGSVAASGGYYIAAATDKIVANPGTITGSIGVILGYTNFEELMRKIGLAPVVIKSGAYKDIGSPVRPMKPDERDLLENVTQKIHSQFVMDVAGGRSLAIEQVEPIADGRIMTGEEAKQLGLVDQLGNFEDALQLAGDLSGVKGPVEPVYPKQDNVSMLRELMESALRIVIEGRFQSTLKPAFMMTGSGGNE